ncbi:Hemicentin-1 [Eumeta japonica]|uniref:Hemicentin-1 n=1 Tax=Eumeta variegata TaxID=151549 RepID=A0A4C1S8Z2_EUMVA|nr:Hemicentin-1 [Eumeta japonica]
MLRFLSGLAVGGEPWRILSTVYGENIMISRDDDDEIWSVGEKREIICIGTQRNQKLRWKNPLGIEVERRRPDNTRVYSQERSVHGSMPTLALLFTRVAAKDSGMWSCHAGDQSLFTNVCVMDPAVFVTTETEVNIDPGRAITLTCEARGKPEPTMLWYRDGNLIVDEYVKGEPSKYKLMTKYNVHSYESLLTISSLEASDAGVYVCAAVQDSEFCSSNKTLDIILNLNHPPTILSDSMSENIYVQYDENITLNCETGGYPLPEITWFQQYSDGVKKLDTDNDWIIITEDNKSQLQFRVDNETVGASFLCTVSNKHGEAEKVFKIVPIIEPLAPDTIILANATDTTVTFKAYWDSIDDESAFPIEGIKVYYVKKSRAGGRKSESTINWNKAKVVILNGSNLIGDLDGIQFTLNGLSPDTTYFMLLRVYNDAAYSVLSKQVKFSTPAFPPMIEEPLIVERDEVNEETEKDDIVVVTEAEDLPGTTDRIASSEVSESSPISVDSNNFYALVFGVGIFVVIGGCMFIMKKMYKVAASALVFCPVIENSGGPPSFVAIFSIRYSISIRKIGNVKSFRVANGNRSEAVGGRRRRRRLAPPLQSDP